MPVPPEATIDLRRPTDVRAELRGRRGLRLVRHYDRSTWIVHDLDRVSRPLLTVALLKLLSRREATLQDLSGRSERVTWRTVGNRAGHAMRDILASKRLMRNFTALLDELSAPRPAISPLGPGPAVYLWTDIVPGLVAGGAVTHVAGVLNNLGRTMAAPIFVTTQRLPLLADDIECHVIDPPRRHWDRRDLVSIAYNGVLLDALPSVLGIRAPSFVYQRHARWTIAGLAAARRSGIPLILEYNGSELWMATNWGSPIKRQDLARRVEDVNLKGADLVVVVSAALKDELVARGVDPERILVNSNGVDADRFSPHVDGTPVRTRYRLAGRSVVGFIGTFGAWHGAEALAAAGALLLDRRPDLVDRIVFFFIGDGPRRVATEAIADRSAHRSCFLFTGLVPQEEGPAYLAACDVLVAPQVPNADGTPFFGSPTKLFEYMAAGRGIVASDLDQIGEVLEHGRTAWLVPPADSLLLSAAVEHLVDRPQLRARLGAAARQQAVARHTWASHTDRIVAAVRGAA